MVHADCPLGSGLLSVGRQDRDEQAKMTRLFKILLAIVMVAIGLALAAMAMTYFVASRSIPDFDKDVRVAGITGRVEILRDNKAIPHVFAQGQERDVFFGLGYAHAEDRLWQMLMMRRAAQGRLSESFGPATLRIDEMMRTLDIYNIARASVAHQSAETMAILEAYADGVNARLRAIQSGALGRGAPELFLFSNQLAPWTPADSLSVVRLMALQLTDKAQSEVLQARLTLLLEPERLRDLFPDQQGKAVMALPEFAHLRDGAPNGAFTSAVKHPLDPVPTYGTGGASNAFAVAPERSAAGATLLATDPHLGFSAPGIWMLARLELDTGGVIGATIPGLPAIVMGRNANFGWGLTSAYLDDQDIFVEKLKPDDPSQYLTPTGHKAFERRDVLIEVKDQPGTSISVLKSRHGPIIDAKHWSLGAILPPGHVASLAWTGLDPEDRSLDALLGLMRAQTVEEGRTATGHAVALSQIVTMADRTSIAIQAAGRMPNRRPDHTSQGRIPAPGWLVQNDWDGYLPFADNPGLTDPDSGIVANTNNRLTDEAFPRHWSFEYGDDQRIQRVTRMLNQREFHTLDSFIEIQTDTVSSSARTLIPLIARDLWYFDQPAAVGTVERRRQQALDLLADWNGDMSEHDPEPLIYVAWVRELQHRLISDDLNRLSENLTRTRPLFIERVYRDIDGAAAWCDVIQTPREETCSEIAQSSLDAALLALTETYGERIESWRWGGAHQALHKHEVLGSIPLLSWFVNIRHDTPGGDNTLLRGVTQGNGAEPFLNVHGAGFRAVYDFSDPEASVFIIATGQSGHFLSRHYDDLAQIWRRSEYIPMTLNPILARGGSVGVTVLLPQEDE